MPYGSAARRASAEGDAQEPLHGWPLRVTSFVARGAGVGGLLPAGCLAGVAELFLVSPQGGLEVWEEYVRARAAPPACHPLPAFLGLSISPLPKRTPVGPPGGEFLEVGEKGKVGPPRLCRPQAAVSQSWCGRCSTPLYLSLPSIPSFQPLKD